MTNRIKCSQARAGIRQLVRGKKFDSKFSKDIIVNHVEGCMNCKEAIKKSIEGGSTGYGDDFESTITAARETWVRNLQYHDGTVSWDRGRRK